MKKEKWLLIILPGIILCLIVNSGAVSRGVAESLTLCGRVLLPSLYPFCLIGCLLTEPGMLQAVSKKLRIWFLFFLSNCSGYPIGAAMLNRCVRFGKLTEEEANRLLPCFTAPGPGFTISYIGIGLFSSRKMGVLLFLGQFFAGLSLFLLRRGYRSVIQDTNGKSEFSFVRSVNRAGQSMITIFFYVLLSGILNAMLCVYLSEMPRKLSVLLIEVTTAVSCFGNLYLDNLALSFAGFCIHLQILSLCDGFRVRYSSFLLFRLLHAVLSTTYLFFLLRIFSVELPVFAGSKGVTVTTTNGIACAVTLIFSAFVMICSLTQKNSSNFGKNLL